MVSPGPGPQEAWAQLGGPFCVLIAMVHEDKFPEEILVPGRSRTRILPDTNALGRGRVGRGSWFRCRQLCSKPGLSLFNRENRANAQFKTQEARNTLKLWKKSYFDIRAKIEASGREARWEFDRKRLFERTDYMANICQDLSDVLQVGAPSEMCVDLSDGEGAFGPLHEGRHHAADLKGPVEKRLLRERCIEF